MCELYAGTNYEVDFAIDTPSCGGSADDKKSKTKDIEVDAGIAVGCLLVIAIVVGVVIWYRRRHATRYTPLL